MPLSNLYIKALSKGQSSKHGEVGSREEGPWEACAYGHTTGEGPACLPWEAEEVEPGHPASEAKVSSSPFSSRHAPLHIPSAAYYYTHTSETY